MLVAADVRAPALPVGREPDGFALGAPGNQRDALDRHGEILDLRVRARTGAEWPGSATYCEWAGLMPLGDAPGGSAAPKVRPGPLAHTWLPSHRSHVKVNPSSLADGCLWATRPRKMSQTAHGQGKARSGTLLLTSGADAAAHGPGGTAPTSPQFWPTAAWALGPTLYFPEPALGAFRKVEGELGRLIKIVSAEVVSVPRQPAAKRPPHSRRSQR
jgi:hypothetical protein